MKKCLSKIHSKHMQSTFCSRFPVSPRQPHGSMFTPVLDAEFCFWSLNCFPAYVNKSFERKANQPCYPQQKCPQFNTQLAWLHPGWRPHLIWSTAIKRAYPNWLSRWSDEIVMWECPFSAPSTCCTGLLQRRACCFLEVAENCSATVTCLGCFTRDLRG